MCDVAITIYSVDYYLYLCTRDGKRSAKMLTKDNQILNIKWNFEVISKFQYNFCVFCSLFAADVT